MAPIGVHIFVTVDKQEQSRKFNDHCYACCSNYKIPCYVLLQVQNECQILRLGDKGEGGM